MAIARFENVDVNTLTFAVDSYGAGNTIITKKFTSRPLVSSVRKSLAISEKYRVYSDLIEFKFNYTPFMEDVSYNQNLYSFTWNGQDWRVIDVIEANDRMSITVMCYRSDPATKV
jgi:hypothetical protein